MSILAIIAGLLLLFIVLGDTFETIILPRGVMRPLRLARLFYQYSWRLWSTIARRVSAGDRREALLSFFGPLSLPVLLAVWAGCLVMSFALLQWGIGSTIAAREDNLGFFTDLYLSGTTFFTLGLGDVTPRTQLARAIVVVEAGVGFGFLAIVIGYLPVLYQSFSRRELSISLLDARAGSPPCGGEMVRRYGEAGRIRELPQLLLDWERWAAELLESHISYPVLTYYRSQHDRQSWLAALTAVLDTSALLSVGIADVPTWQARLTFAMARHAVVDLALIFNIPPVSPMPDRLSQEQLARLRAILSEAGAPLSAGADADQKLTELRQLYEPYINTLAEYFFFRLPPWFLPQRVMDDWETTKWQHDGHFTGVFETTSSVQ